jgi:hypothetical protein
VAEQQRRRAVAGKVVEHAPQVVEQRVVARDRAACAIGVAVAAQVVGADLETDGGQSLRDMLIAATVLAEAVDYEDRASPGSMCWPGADECGCAVREPEPQLGRRSWFSR